jgi:hypothetical protein
MNALNSSTLSLFLKNCVKNILHELHPLNTFLSIEEIIVQCCTGGLNLEPSVSYFLWLMATTIPQLHSISVTTEILHVSGLMQSLSYV